MLYVERQGGARVNRRGVCAGRHGADLWDATVRGDGPLAVFGGIPRANSSRHVAHSSRHVRRGAASECFVWLGGKHGLVGGQQPHNKTFTDLER